MFDGVTLGSRHSSPSKGGNIVRRVPSFVEYPLYLHRTCISWGYPVRAALVRVPPYGTTLSGQPCRRLDHLSGDTIPASPQQWPWGCSKPCPWLSRCSSSSLGQRVAPHKAGGYVPMVSLISGECKWGFGVVGDGENGRLVGDGENVGLAGV